jgi:hypothetical protein
MYNFRDRPFNLKGGEGVLIPNVAEKKYSDFGGGKKKIIAFSFCHIT